MSEISPNLRSQSAIQMKTQQGFSLFTALFVIVVLSMLAASIYRLNATSNIAVSQQVLSTRAFFAAEAGLQSAAMRAFPLAGAGACGNFTTMFTGGGLNSCQVSVACSQYSSGGETFYEVISTGQCNMGSDYSTSRIIEALFNPL